jgi:hypothetical protein
MVEARRITTMLVGVGSGFGVAGSDGSFFAVNYSAISSPSASPTSYTAAATQARIIGSRPPHEAGPLGCEEQLDALRDLVWAHPSGLWGKSPIANVSRQAHSVVMPVLIVSAALLIGALLSPFRRCLLMLPLTAACAIGGWVANDLLWKATGGTYGDCTDVCFAPKEPGTASAAFEPLWALTVVGLALICVAAFTLLVRGANRARRAQLDAAHR